MEKWQAILGRLGLPVAEGNLGCYPEVLDSRNGARCSVMARRSCLPSRLPTGHGGALARTHHGLLRLLGGVGQFLAEACLGVQDKFLAVQEECRCPGHAERPAVGDVFTDPVTGFLIRHGGVVLCQVQSQILCEGPEQRRLGFLLFAPLGLGFEHLGVHLFVLALLRGSFDGQGRCPGVPVSRQWEVSVHERDPVTEFLLQFVHEGLRCPGRTRIRSPETRPVGPSPWRVR